MAVKFLAAHLCTFWLLVDLCPSTPCQHTFLGLGEGEVTWPDRQPYWARDLNFLKAILWSWNLLELIVDQGKCANINWATHGCIIA